MRALGSALAVLAALSGCAVDGDPAKGGSTQMTDQDLPAAARVTYEFRDSSVPPPYHRSYVLTFDRSAARIVVDSYGDVLADRTAPMTETAWGQVSKSYPGIRGVRVADPEQGCTGGTSFAVTVADGDRQDLVVRGLACGGVNSEVAEQLAAWVRPARELFPPMNELAPEG